MQSTAAPQAPLAVPAATTPSVMGPASPVNPYARLAAQSAQDEQQRSMWRQGSILEIYSSSAGHWFPALVLRVQKGEGAPDVLTMQFWLHTEEAKQKSLYRNDVQMLAPLGANLEGELPPGFVVKPSQSRPGQNVFLDQTSGMKYQTAELAWQTHFQRLLERPAAAGMETVCHLPGQSSFQASKHGVDGMAAGLVTEYQADSGNGMQAMPNQKQAANVALGLVTEHGPVLKKASPAQNQAPQQIPGAPSAIQEQRQQQHGSQLAAELLPDRRRQGGGCQQPVHHY